MNWKHRESAHRWADNHDGLFWFHSKTVCYLFSLRALYRTRFGCHNTASAIDGTHDCVDEKLIHRLVGKKVIFSRSRNLGLTQRQCEFDCAAYEGRPIFLVGNQAIDPLHRGSVQTQRCFNSQSFRPCHARTIGRTTLTLQTDTSHNFSNHLLLTYKVVFKIMQTMRRFPKSAIRFLVVAL